eukprot:2376371-Prymnesium_polylepis.1
MLVDIVGAAAPTHLLVLDKPPTGHAPTALSLASLGVGPGFPLQPSVLRLAGLPSSPAARGWASVVASAPPASETRAMQTLSYFGALPAGARSLPGAIEGYDRPAWQDAIAGLLCAKPLCVPLAALRIAFPPSARGAASTTDAELLELLNGRIVGLLRLPPGVAIADGAASAAVADGCRGMLLPPSGCECEGLGIVRSVDPASGMLYVLTPARHERVARVDALALGALELPMAMLLPTAYTGPSPYVTAEAVRSAGAAAMHSRNNIVRATG